MKDRCINETGKEFRRRITGWNREIETCQISNGYEKKKLKQKLV